MSERIHRTIQSSSVEKSRNAVERKLPDNGIVTVVESVMIKDEYGTVAKEPIEKGRKIFEITGPIYDAPTIYTFQYGENAHLDPQNADGTPSFGHYTNHSCEPTAYVRIADRNGDGHGIIEVLARKDIPVGDEVSLDYAAMEYDPVAEGMECKCGAPNCRGTIGGYKQLDLAIKARYIEEGIVSQYLLDLDDQPKAS